jgi:hypothetical protein
MWAVAALPHAGILILGLLPPRGRAILGRVMVVAVVAVMAMMTVMTTMPLVMMTVMVTVVARRGWHDNSSVLWMCCSS